MTTRTHTPGPWAVDSDLPPNARSIVARTSGGVPISGAPTGPHDPSGDAANARLIAAAPAMLAALKALVANPRVEISLRGRFGDAQSQVHRALAAIARAEGVEP